MDESANYGKLNFLMSIFRRFAPFLLLVSLGFAAHATTLPSGFSDSNFATGLSAPTAMSFAPDGRLFVCQQSGAIRIIENGQLLAQPFLQIAVDSLGERGLLGIAFHPNFTKNRKVYFYYTVPGENGGAPHNRVVRVRASESDPNVADLTTLEPIFDLPELNATNHNGGAIHFASGGKLFIAVGENAVPERAQQLTNPFGKILRINPDGSIPTANPFYRQTRGKNRAIWALGLRNPYTFAFDSQNGQMFINDVGQSAWEEINRGKKGANYGWPRVEGPSDSPNYKAPLFAYKHDEGCSIIGGAVYRANQFPASFDGKYFFADFCGQWIHVLDPQTKTVADFAADLPSAPVDLQVGPDGALYYLTRNSGVRRIHYSAPSAKNGQSSAQKF